MDCGRVGCTGGCVGNEQMRGTAGLSGFWSDALDVSLDGAQPMLKQLAARKLMSEGVIQPRAIAQPTFYAVASQTDVAQPSPPSPGNGSDFAKVAVAVLVVLILFGR